MKKSGSNIAKIYSLFVFFAFCILSCSEYGSSSENTSSGIINQYIQKLKSKHIKGHYGEFYAFTPLGIIRDSAQARAIVYSFLVPQELSYYNPRYGYMEADIILTNTVVYKVKGHKVVGESAVYGNTPDKAFLVSQRAHRHAIRTSLMKIIKPGDKYGIIEWKSQYKYAKDSPTVIKRILTPCLYNDSGVIYNIVTGISSPLTSNNNQSYLRLNYHYDLILKTHIIALKAEYYDSVKKARKNNMRDSVDDIKNP